MERQRESEDLRTKIGSIGKAGASEGESGMVGKFGEDGWKQTEVNEMPNKRVQI